MIKIYSKCLKNAGKMKTVMTGLKVLLYWFLYFFVKSVSL